MFERFTDRARKVMALANQEAQRFNHEYIGPEHMLLGIIKEGSGVGANVLKNLGVEMHNARAAIEKLIKADPDMITMGRLPQNQQARACVLQAIEAAKELQHNYVGTEHLLMGLLRVPNTLAIQALTSLGLDTDKVKAGALSLLVVETPASPAPASKGAVTAFSITPAPQVYGLIPNSLRAHIATACMAAMYSNSKLLDKATKDWVESGGLRPSCVAEWFAGMAREAADALIAELDKSPTPTN